MNRGNHLYKRGIENMMSGNLTPALNTGSSGADFRFLCALVGSGYVPASANLNTDQFYSTELGTAGGTGGNQVGSQVVLTAVTCSDALGIGVTLDAADTTFSAVAGGSTVKGIVLFQSGTEGSADYLFGYWDQDGGVDISIATNGGDITVQWNSDGITMISGGV